jgi:FkbM family methyltransferase
MIRKIKAVARRQLGPGLIDEPEIAHRVLGSGGGVMLDVGACWGESFQSFVHDSRWQIHAFEPDAVNRSTLHERFGNHRNVHIIPMGVSSQPGSMTLYTSPESPGISTLAPFRTSHEPSATIEVTTLAAYTAENSINRVDFLKIDVEGFEREVLAGFDWCTEPRCIVLEFEDAKTQPRGYAWTDLADILVQRGYDVRISEWFPITRYGGVHSWRRFATYPATLVDPLSWGNLMAFKNVRPQTVRSVLARAALANRLWVIARRLRLTS